MIHSCLTLLKLILVVFHLLIGAMLTLFISIITPYIWTATFDTLLLLFRIHESHASLVLGVFFTFVCGRYVLKYWLWELSNIWHMSKAIRPSYIRISGGGVEGYRLASI